MQSLAFDKRTSQKAQMNCLETAYMGQCNKPKEQLAHVNLRNMKYEIIRRLKAKKGNYKGTIDFVRDFFDPDLGLMDFRTMMTWRDLNSGSKPDIHTGRDKYKKGLFDLVRGSSAFYKHMKILKDEGFAVHLSGKGRNIKSLILWKLPEESLGEVLTHFYEVTYGPGKSWVHTHNRFNPNVGILMKINAAFKEQYPDGREVCLDTRVNVRQLVDEKCEPFYLPCVESADPQVRTVHSAVAEGFVCSRGIPLIYISQTSITEIYHNHLSPRLVGRGDTSVRREEEQPAPPTPPDQPQKEEDFELTPLPTDQPLWMWVLSNMQAMGYPMTEAQAKARYELASKVLQDQRKVTEYIVKRMIGNAARKSGSYDLRKLWRYFQDDLEGFGGYDIPPRLMVNYVKQAPPVAPPPLKLVESEPTPAPKPPKPQRASRLPERDNTAEARRTYEHLLGADIEDLTERYHRGDFELIEAMNSLGKKLEDLVNDWRQMRNAVPATSRPQEQRAEQEVQQSKPELIGPRTEEETQLGLSMLQEAKRKLAEHGVEKAEQEARAAEQVVVEDAPKCVEATAKQQAQVPETSGVEVGKEAQKQLPGNSEQEELIEEQPREVIIPVDDAPRGQVMTSEEFAKLINAGTNPPVQEPKTLTDWDRAMEHINRMARWRMITPQLKYEKSGEEAYRVFYPADVGFSEMIWSMVFADAFKSILGHDRVQIIFVEGV